MRFVFDLTTAAHWNGPPVGIVRVERELARRARQHLGPDLVFSLYDRFRNRFLTVDDDTASGIINGEIHVDFAPARSTAIGERAKQQIIAARRRLRNTLLSNTAAYQLSQRIRGRSITRERILQIQAMEFNGECRKVTSLTGVDELPHQEAHLDADCCIITGGLDWDLKNLTAIASLRQSSKFRYCAIIHDLIPIKFPHFITPPSVESLTKYFRELADLADFTMCNSDSTRRDWLQYTQDIAHAPIPSRVFPLGSDLPNERIEADDVKLPQSLRGKRFALYVSTIEPRKNHRVLYEAWNKNIRAGQLDPINDRLVFVGHHGWSTGDLLGQISVNPATRDTILVMNGLSDAELAALYRECKLVLFPSHYEGFGLALAEALAFGKPCISSDAGAMPEIGGDLVLRLNARDTIGWGNAIARFMKPDSGLDAWEARVRKEYRPTTWDRSAQIFFDAVKESVLEH